MAEALFQLGQKALIVNEKNEVLLVGQTKLGTSDKIWYDLPGGRVKEDEDHLGKVLARELYEELRIEVQIHELLTLSLSPRHPKRKYDILLAVYRCTLTKGVPTPSDDILEFRWVTFEELYGMPDARYSKETVETFKNKLGL